MSDKELQLQLLQALLKSQPEASSSSSIPSDSSTAGLPSLVSPRMGPMQGLLLGEAPEAALNRNQLMQALFRLELNSQAPQVFLNTLVAFHLKCLVTLVLSTTL